MGEFQLILLNEVRNRARAGMAFSLPPHGPAVDLRNDPAWMLPGDALARVEAALGDRTISIDTIVARLKAGLIKATFETFGWENINTPPKVENNIIEPKYWRHYQASDRSSYVWKTGDLRLWTGSTYSNSMLETDVVITFFRIKIERRGIDEIVANAPQKPEPKRVKWIKRASPQPPKEAENKGGRPRKEWWDDFWIAICGQIYEGDLKPKTQSELEKVMLDWVENHNADVGETTIKAAAKKLFNAWKLGVKN